MQFPERRKDDLTVSEMDGEILIYNQRTNKAFCLNDTSARIWKLCDGQRNLSEISRFLEKDLNAVVDEALIWLALEQLQQLDLIKYDIAPPESISGLSRRQALRKIGVAAVITLPLVSSIVAPTPLSAASPSQPAPFQIVVPIPLATPDSTGQPTPPVSPAPTVSPIFAPIPLAVFP
jgi:Coenzyme PQQ synthesis protein D (PqqD)